MFTRYTGIFSLGDVDELSLTGRELRLSNLFEGNLRVVLLGVQLTKKDSITFACSASRNVRYPNLSSWSLVIDNFEE